jgi:signal transduction histidine kinase
LASEKDLELVYSEPSGPVRILSSDLALRQILTNVIDNAIKYTPKGKVTVALSASPTQVIWRVGDTGIGLSPEEQLKVFTRFFRSQRPEARLTKGTGLGLALSKALVERLGGTIRVQSTVDKGSTFTIEIPR